jgi:hypothetical protein
VDGWGDAPKSLRGALKNAPMPAARLQAGREGGCMGCPLMKSKLVQVIKEGCPNDPTIGGNLNGDETEEPLYRRGRVIRIVEGGRRPDPRVLHEPGGRVVGAIPKGSKQVELSQMTQKWLFKG